MTTQNTQSPSHSDIMKYIEDIGCGGDSIQLDGNPTPETYEDAKRDLIEINK